MSDYDFSFVFKKDAPALYDISFYLNNLLHFKPLEIHSFDDPRIG